MSSRMRYRILIPGLAVVLTLFALPAFPQAYVIDTKHNLSSTAGADIDAPEAWHVSQGSVSQIVAVVDTGIAYSHAALGDAAWMALYGKYPTDSVATPDFTTLMMFESKATPLYPNNFRYYGSTCISLAFPGKTILPLPKGKPLDYRTRFVIFEGKTTLEEVLRTTKDVTVRADGGSATFAVEPAGAPLRVASGAGDPEEGRDA